MAQVAIGIGAVCSALNVSLVLGIALTVYIMRDQCNEKIKDCKPQTGGLIKEINVDKESKSNLQGYNILHR